MTGQTNKPSEAIGYVSYLPNLRQFGTSIDRGSDHESETGPEFASIDKAVDWVSERAPVGYVLLGTVGQVVFGIGDTANDPDAEQVEGLRPWPPAPEELERLIAQMDVDYENAIAKPRGDFPDSVIIETEGD